jgi:inorganic triphosphatase YgiF
MRRELELKVELSKSDVERLGGKLPASDLAVGPAATRRLRTVYFDTLEHDLHAAGVSLRLRNQNGRWLQTVKADQQVANGISNPVELEAPVESDKPDLGKIADKKIKRTVQNAAKGTSLHPIFETVVRRTTRRIKAQGDDIELAIDDGVVRAGRASRELREAELELKAGSAAGLLLAAEKLLGDQELKLSAYSKAERGYQLASSRSDTNVTPEKARPARVGRKDTCAKAFSNILASASRQILANRQAVLHTDDPEGAHQLRNGLRRLRSALRALRFLADGSSLRAFERSARDMGRCVGMLRNADVVISAIHAPAEAAASDKTGFAELRKALVRDLHDRRNKVRTALRGPGWTKLQIYLSLWPRTLEEGRVLDERITKYARKVLSKAWKKTDDLGGELERLDAEHRHEMRKALKNLRYQTEFFAPLFEKRETRYFIEQLKSLQDVFGYVNDVCMAPHLVEVQEELKAGADAARAANYAVGWHEAEAAHVWRQADKGWKALKHSARFWI